MSVFLKPGMQGHHALGNPLTTPGNLLGNVNISSAQSSVTSPLEQPVVADSVSQPADTYVVQHEPIKRHWSQRAGLGGGVFLAASLALGLVSASLDRDVEVDHLPEGITCFLDGGVPGLGNNDFASAQLFAELEGEMFPMELLDGMPSDLLSGGTLASAGSNPATLFASAKPKGQWKKFMKQLGNNKGIKWLKKKLKKPAAWISKNPFASMSIMAGLFLLNLITLRKWLKARSTKNGKKIYVHDIPKGHYYDTGVLFIGNSKVLEGKEKGQYTIITSSQAQRDVLAGFTEKPATRLGDVLRKLYREDSPPYIQARLNTEQKIVGEAGWLVEVGEDPDNAGEIHPDNKRYNLTLAPYEVGFFKRRWRYWRCTKRDKKLAEAKWLVMMDQKRKPLPWANRWLKWMPGIMSLRKAKKIVQKANETIALSSPEIVVSIGNGRLTHPRPSSCYEVKGDSVIIHRPKNNPGTLTGWQADVFRSCVDQDPGPKLSIIMLPVKTKYPEVSEAAVQSFLDKLVAEAIMVEGHGHYRVFIPKGTADDAKRISGDKEPVAFYMPPVPKPKREEPEYKMSTDNSSMYIVTPDGDYDVIEGWKLRVLNAARASSPDKAKTTDEIFESIGLMPDEREIFDLFIKSAIAKEWLLGLGDSKVYFVLKETSDFDSPKAPPPPLPHHPKSVDAISNGTGTGDWTGAMDKAAAERKAEQRAASPSAGPSSPPKAAPPVAAGEKPGPTTQLGVALTAFVKGSELAAIGAAAPKKPDPKLQVPQPAAEGAAPKADKAAASVTPPQAAPEAPEAPFVKAAPAVVPPLELSDDPRPAPRVGRPDDAGGKELTSFPKRANSIDGMPPNTVTEKAEDLVKKLPGPRDRGTVVLARATADGLAADSRPQTGIPTVTESGSETPDYPAAYDRPPAVAVTHDSYGSSVRATAEPDEEPDEDDGQTTGRWREAQEQPTVYESPTPKHAPGAATPEKPLQPILQNLGKAAAGTSDEDGQPSPESLPLSERRVKGGKIEGAPVRRDRGGKKIMTPLGETRKTIVQKPEGVGDDEIPLAPNDIEFIEDDGAPGAEGEPGIVVIEAGMPPPLPWNRSDDDGDEG